MADRMIVIESKMGHRVAVTPHDYAHAKVGPAGETYEQMHYAVVSWEEGAPYEPAKKSKPSGG